MQEQYNTNKHSIVIFFSGKIVSVCVCCIYDVCVYGMKIKNENERMC